MTKQEAIERALDALKVQRGSFTFINKPVHAFPEKRYMSLGRDRVGWVVHVPLNVPEFFEPDSISVEVYEPDGEIVIHPAY